MTKHCKKKIPSKCQCKEEENFHVAFRMNSCNLSYYIGKIGCARKLSYTTILSLEEKRKKYSSGMKKKKKIGTIFFRHFAAGH